MQRHAASSGLTVTLVNSSATRGPDAPFPLVRYPLPPYFDELPVNHQGDFGSFAVLAEYGGLYLDTDVLVLHDLSPFINLLKRFQFIGFGGHIYDEGVHHGLMVARPDAEILARAYHAALSVYEQEGDCAGSKCAHIEGLHWLSTLDAFSREAKVLHRLQDKPSSSCAYARLPTRHFEPGMHEHQNYCSNRVNDAFRAALASSDGLSRDSEAERFLASTMAASISGVLRVTHLSTTKSLTASLNNCPLLNFLISVSEGSPNITVLRKVSSYATGAWEQVVQDFSPRLQ